MTDLDAAIPIVTGRLALREFASSDLYAVHAYASDPAVTKYLWWRQQTHDDARRFLARVAREAKARPRRHYQLAVEERASNVLVGGCGLLGRRIEYREYELDYALLRNRWNLGYGTEMVAAITDFGFRSLDAHRIYALVDPENPPSALLLEKLRFRREGCQLEDTLIDGDWRSTWIYALLREEWEIAGPLGCDFESR